MSGIIGKSLLVEGVERISVMGKTAVHIIGGADGPTSVFWAGKKRKQSIKMRIRNLIFRYKKERAKKRILPGGHTLQEVLKYAKRHYGITEISTTQWRYIEQKKSWKEGLLLKYKPELLGEFQHIEAPEDHEEKTLDRFFEQIEKRSEKAKEIPDCKMPMDFHIYEMKYQDGSMEIVVDYHWKMFGISYSGKKKTMKSLKKIAQELYLYYGVTKEDIERKTERYQELLLSLSV